MSSATFKLSHESVRITAVEGVSEALACEWMRECPAWFEECSPEGGMRGRVATVPSPGRDVIAKRGERPSPRSALCALVGRPARSTRAFRLGLALAETPVRTARPLALIERSAASGKWESCLVMERIVARNLREYLLEELPREVAPEAVRSRLLSAVAVAVARLHRAGFRQRDLKAANLLVEPRTDGEFEVILIDFEGMKRFREPPPWRVRMRDLSRLRVSLQSVESPTESNGDVWEYLVREYLRAYENRPSAEEQVSAILEVTGRWAARKIRRNRRRRRPVT